MQVRAWAVLLAIAGIIRPASGTLLAQEIQVPADQAGRVQVISAELARRLGLFTDVKGFSEARLFVSADSSYVLEITSTQGGGLRRERRPMTANEVAEFRRRLTEQITARAPSATLDQGGRTKLLVGSTILGLGYYGWASAMAFDPDNSQTAVAIYMVTGAASFIGPFLATRNRSVSDPVATMALWGAMRGPLHGALVSQLGDAQADKTKFGWSVAFGAVEGIAGGLLGQSLGMSSGHAELTGTGGDIGLATGWGLADVSRLDRRRTITVTQPFGGTYSYETTDRTLRSALTLAASGLGLVGGYWLGSKDEWTRGDAMVFRNLAFMGGLAGVATGDIIQQPRLVTQTFPGGTTSYIDDGFSRVHSAAGLLGGAAGIALGRSLVKGKNFTTGQGTLLTLAPVAGGLLGLGIAYLATPEKQFVYDPTVPYRDPNDHSELYLTMSALGAGAGFAILYPALAKMARGSTLGSNFELSINPLAAAHVLGGRPGSVMLGSVRYRLR